MCGLLAVAGVVVSCGRDSELVVRSEITLEDVLVDVSYEARFEVGNPSSVPWVLSDVSSSCSCSVEPAFDLPITISAGGRASLPVNVTFHSSTWRNRVQLQVTGDAAGQPLRLKLNIAGFGPEEPYVTPGALFLPPRGRAGSANLRVLVPVAGDAGLASVAVPEGCRWDVTEMRKIGSDRWWEYRIDVNFAPGFGDGIISVILESPNRSGSKVLTVSCDREAQGRSLPPVVKARAAVGGGYVVSMPVAAGPNRASSKADWRAYPAAVKIRHASDRGDHIELHCDEVPSVIESGSISAVVVR